MNSELIEGPREFCIAFLKSMPPALKCQKCGEQSLLVEVRFCMTGYADWKLNVDPVLCPECAEDYFEFWKNQWEEYRH